MEQVDAEHVPRPLGELVRGRRRQHREHASALAELERPQVTEQALDVPAELGVEEDAVSPLENDLAELEEDAGLNTAPKLRSRPGP